MKYVEVMVSPFYRGNAFEDEKSNTQFELPESQIKIYAIPTTSDLSGIENLIRKNMLVLVSGELKQEKEVSPVTEQKKQEKAVDAVEDVKVEITEEEDVKNKKEKQEADETIIDLEDLNIASLKALADEKGIEYKGNISKAALLKKMK